MPPIDFLYVPRRPRPSDVEHALRQFKQPATGSPSPLFDMLPTEIKIKICYQVLQAAPRPSTFHLHENIDGCLLLELPIGMKVFTTALRSAKWLEVAAQICFKDAVLTAELTDLSLMPPKMPRQSMKGLVLSSLLANLLEIRLVVYNGMAPALARSMANIQAYCLAQETSNPKRVQFFYVDRLVWVCRHVQGEQPAQLQGQGLGALQANNEGAHGVADRVMLDIEAHSAGSQLHQLHDSPTDGTTIDTSSACEFMIESDSETDEDVSVDVSDDPDNVISGDRLFSLVPDLSPLAAGNSRATLSSKTSLKRWPRLPAVIDIAVRCWLSKSPALRLVGDSISTMPQDRLSRVDVSFLVAVEAHTYSLTVIVNPIRFFRHGRYKYTVDCDLVDFF